jgi:hypothetical protein
VTVVAEDEAGLTTSEMITFTIVQGPTLGEPLMITVTAEGFRIAGARNGMRLQVSTDLETWTDLDRNDDEGEYVIRVGEQEHHHFFRAY